MRHLITKIAVGMAVFALCLPAPSEAGVELESRDSGIRFGEDLLPPAVMSGQWSVATWVFVPEQVTEPGALVSVGERMAVSATPHGLMVYARHAGQSAWLSIPASLQPGRWHLLAVSVDAAGGHARAWLASEAFDGGGGIRSASRSFADQAGGQGLSPDRSWALPGSSPGLSVGSHTAGVHAVPAIYEALTIRDHPLNDTDVDALWRSRDYYGPYRLDARDDGGLMNGWAGASFLTFHAMCSRPNGPGGVESRASWPGAQVNTSNIMVLTRPTPVEPGFSNSFRTVAPVEHANGAVHRSRLESELEGFFHIDGPPFAAPAEPIGPIGTKTAQLVTGPQGLVRVLVSGNSRGTRATSLYGQWPENLAHGMVQARLDQTAGVLMRPATLRDSRGGWFGLNTSTSIPETDNVRSLHARDDSWADFTRFGSGTVPSESLGPGAATSVGPGGLYRLRCGPVDGSLLVADAPLVVRTTLLAFPGSSSLVWYPERGEEQDGPELRVGESAGLSLDTTRVEYRLSDQDVFISDTTLALHATVDVRIGDAIVVMSGGARGAVSTVVGVQSLGDSTVAELSHAFGETPGSGADLRIGPWRFESVEHRFDAVPDGDDRSWRGQVLIPPSDDLLGLMVYSVSAWRPDVDGFIIGSAGQGGNGYTAQLEKAFPRATAAWAAESEVDVWLVGLAGQHSLPPCMTDYVVELRTTMAEHTEFVWVSDAVHAHTSHAQWHRYLAENARSSGVAAVFAVGSPKVGSYLEQAASGMRADDSHFTPFGNRVIAEAWLDQLSELVADSCLVADYNGDESVDVFDLLNFQTDWEAGDPRADLDGDGQFSIFDYLVLLTAMDDCV